jgi:hypothetical protein
MAPRVLQTYVYDEPRYGHIRTPGVLKILEEAGYVSSERSEQAGTYEMRSIDVDGRTGTETYELRVVEDAARPVIDRIQQAMHMR